MPQPGLPGAGQPAVYRLLHRLCAKSDRPSENFAILRSYLAQCITEPRQLSGRNVGKIRAILAAINAKRGLPGSERCHALRRAQRAQVRGRHRPCRAAPAVWRDLCGLPTAPLAAAAQSAAPGAAGGAVVGRGDQCVPRRRPPRARAGAADAGSGGDASAHSVSSADPAEQAAPGVPRAGRRDRAAPADRYLSPAVLAART